MSSEDFLRTMKTKRFQSIRMNGFLERVFARRCIHQSKQFANFDIFGRSPNKSQRIACAEVNWKTAQIVGRILTIDSLHPHLVGTINFYNIAIC